MGVGEQGPILSEVPSIYDHLIPIQNTHVHVMLW